MDHPQLDPGQLDGHRMYPLAPFDLGQPNKAQQNNRGAVLAPLVRDNHWQPDRGQRGRGAVREGHQLRRRAAEPGTLIT